MKKKKQRMKPKSRQRRSEKRKYNTEKKELKSLFILIKKERKKIM